MSDFPEIDGMSFPDPEIFDQLANTFGQWGSQHQDFLYQLKTGHDILQENWEGDGATSYRILHARAQDTGNKHVEHFQNVSSGLKEMSGKVSVVQGLLAIAKGLIAAAIGIGVLVFGGAAVGAATGAAVVATESGVVIAALTGFFLSLASNVNTLLPPPDIGDGTGAPPFPGSPSGPSVGLSPTQLPAPPPTPTAFPLPSATPTSGPAFYFGDITSPNPNIWLYLPSIGDNPRYVISTNMPPSSYPNEEDWLSVNQFCSLLSTAWLLNGNHPGTFTLNGNFTPQQVSAMASALIDQDQGLQGQVDRAIHDLGGQQQSFNEVEAGVTGSYPVGTRIWTGNDQHVVAVYINSATEYTVYDPNTGQTTTYSRSNFVSATVNTFGLNVFVVKTP